MIRTLITERETTQNDAIKEVSSKWADEQTVSGPFISIPYYKFMRDNMKRDSAEKLLSVKDYIHILPSQLKITGNLDPKERHRGIYEIVVYSSKINISGTFDAIDLKGFGIPENSILLDKAEFVVGIDDMRGLEEQINLKWNDQNISFNPGVSSDDIVASGINALLTIVPQDSAHYNFSFDLNLKGSQMLYFTPVGKVTDINFSSNWPNPKFDGAFLPDSNHISNTGFTANWNILHLNRNYPQQWLNNKYSIKQSAFGINLLLPVDNYQKSYRSARYAILFIGFTFLTFFFIEMLNKIYIHPVQYILVGVALIVFYTLLLSISEHLNYNLAFIISALATLMLITGYVKAIIKSVPLTFLLTGLLTTMYSFIFVIIQLQDYALLIGSIGVFIILALVMYFSRKIDWYEISMEQKGLES